MNYTTVYWLTIQDSLSLGERKEEKQAGAELCQAQDKLGVKVYIGVKVKVWIVVKVWIQLLAWVVLNLTPVEVKF